MSDNSCAESLKRVEKITGKSVKLYEADVRDEKALRKIFKKNIGVSPSEYRKKAHQT